MDLRPFRQRNWSLLNSGEPLDRETRVKRKNSCRQVLPDNYEIQRIITKKKCPTEIISDDCSLSYNDLHTVGIVNCSESYDNLKATCQTIFNQLNELAEKKCIVVNGKNIDLDVFLCGDMKFIQILLGLCGATGIHACPWCIVHKNDRYDVTKSWNFYHSAEMFGTHEKINFLSSQSKNNLGVKNKPLVKIEMDHIVPDELHLMLRVTDVLMRNLIFDSKDKDDHIKSSKAQESADNLFNLISLIQSCGVSFKVWTPKGSNELEWTSLSGAEKVRLLKALPEKLLDSHVLHCDSQESVTKLWKDFYILYLLILSRECESLTGEEIFCKIKTWLEDFLSIGQKRKGYLKVNVTPYLHCFVYHVPFFISQYGSLKKFSNQGVEKINDVVKNIHQRKTSKWDGPNEALGVRKRLELSSVENVCREKRSYVKKSDEYWESTIFVTRQAKRRQIDSEIFQASEIAESEIDIENLSDNELRDLIFKKQGRKTKLRNRSKLVDLLKSLC